MKRSTWIWIITALTLIVIVVSQYIQLDDAADIPGGFDRVAYVRNENNQGGIYQYYVFTVQDISSADYTALIGMLPFHGKSGETTVFFFDKNQPYPKELRLESPHFDTTKYFPVAVYVRNKTGVKKM